MVIAVLDLLTHGREYAKMCIANAKALAETLHTEGCEVFMSVEKASRIPSTWLCLQQLMVEEILPQSFWKNPIYSPVELVCPCLLFRETLTRCVWEPRKLQVGECARKIWKRLPTYLPPAAETGKTGKAEI